MARPAVKYFVVSHANVSGRIRAHTENLDQSSLKAKRDERERRRTRRTRERGRESIRFDIFRRRFFLLEGRGFFCPRRKGVRVSEARKAGVCFWKKRLAPTGQEREKTRRNLAAASRPVPEINDKGAPNNKMNSLQSLSTRARPFAKKELGEERQVLNKRPKEYKRRRRRKSRAYVHALSLKNASDLE